MKRDPCSGVLTLPDHQLPLSASFRFYPLDLIYCYPDCRVMPSCAEKNMHEIDVLSGCLNFGRVRHRNGITVTRGGASVNFVVGSRRLININPGFCLVKLMVSSHDTHTKQKASGTFRKRLVLAAESGLGQTQDKQCWSTIPRHNKKR